MIKVSVFYPNGPDIHFDMPYYLNRHMKMVQRLVGPALKGAAVEQGISGTEPGSRPLYVALGHLIFESIADFQSSFGAHADEIVADVPNYTNSQPIIQISEVKM
jgi:uncharacterized protein (TIGR02118 family)